MGLFDGGGFDMDALMNMINPMGTAEAANALCPNGAPQTGLTPDALAASVANTPPLSSLPAITPPAPPAAPPRLRRTDLGRTRRHRIRSCRSIGSRCSAAARRCCPGVGQAVARSACNGQRRGSSTHWRSLPLVPPTGNTDVGARAKSPDDAKNPVPRSRLSEV